jgi:predicted RNA binding protein YcfA (HicA-like mRNA interferase family)
MPGIKPVNWKVLECVFKKAGFKLSRHKGSSHRVYTKKGVDRPIIILTYSEVSVTIIANNLKTAGISREKYFELLEECK